MESGVQWDGGRRGVKRNEKEKTSVGLCTNRFLPSEGPIPVSHDRTRNRLSPFLSMLPCWFSAHIVFVGVCACVRVWVCVCVCVSKLAEKALPELPFKLLRFG